MAIGGLAAAAAKAAKAANKPKKKKQPTRKVDQDVERDFVTDERKGYKNVTRPRLHGGTVTKNKTYEGDVTKTEKIKTDRSGKVKKVVLKTRKQVDAYKNKKGTASRLSQDNNAKRTGAIKPKETTSRKVLKGKAAQKHVDDKKKAALAAAAAAAAAGVRGENAQERTQDDVRKRKKGLSTNLRGEPMRRKNPYYAPKEEKKYKRE